MFEDNVPQPIRTFSKGEGPIHGLHGDRIQRPLPTVIGARRGDQSLQLCTASSRHYSPKILWPMRRTTFGRKSFRTFRPTSDKEIHQVLRNQYSIAYSLTTSQRPTSGSVWPTKREILSNTTIVAKAGYTAPDELE